MQEGVAREGVLVCCTYSVKGCDDAVRGEVW